MSQNKHSLSKILLLSIIVFISCDQKIQIQNTSIEKGVTQLVSNEDKISFQPIPIEESLIDEIINFKGSQAEVNEINRRIYKKLGKTKLSELDKYFIMNPIFVDLNSDNQNEIICSFGHLENYLTIGIFKKLEDKWNCIFFEDFGNHYNGVELNILNNSSKNKVISVTHLEERGSGIYKEVVYFFKLIKNEVKPCLRILKEARINGWVFLNQTVTSDYSISNIYNQDNIWVNYKYRYYPVEYNGKLGNEDFELTIIEGKEAIIYDWDDIKQEYIPKFKSESDNYGLSKEQIRCFEDFGNDSLIIQSFQKDFEHIKREGSEIQKGIVKRYTEMINNE